MDFRPNTPRPFGDLKNPLGRRALGDFSNPLRTRGDLGKIPPNKVRVFYTNYKRPFLDCSFSAYIASGVSQRL